MVTAMHLLALALLLGSTSGDTLSGRITDSDGAPVPSAAVLISELHRVATSSAEGAFLLADIPPGQYTVIVRHVGFAPFAREVAVHARTQRGARLAALGGGALGGRPAARPERVAGAFARPASRRQRAEHRRPDRQAGDPGPRGRAGPRARQREPSGRLLME